MTVVKRATLSERNEGRTSGSWNAVCKNVSSWMEQKCQITVFSIALEIANCLRSIKNTENWEDKKFIFVDIKSLPF